MPKNAEKMLLYRESELEFRLTSKYRPFKTVSPIVKEQNPTQTTSINLMVNIFSIQPDYTQLMTNKLFTL